MTHIVGVRVGESMITAIPRVRRIVGGGAESLLVGESVQIQLCVDAAAQDEGTQGVEVCQDDDGVHQL